MSFTIKDRLSYYQESTRYPYIERRIDSDIKTDICIVGGGYTGISAALHLAQKGFDVTLIEANNIGYGASGRNGGQAIIGFHHEYGAMEKTFGKDIANQTWNIAKNSMDLLNKHISDYDIQCDFKKNYMILANKKSHMEYLRHSQEENEKLHYNFSHMIEKKDLPEFIESDAYEGALYDTQSGHLHPLNYALGLAHAAIKEGAKIFTQTKALHIDVHAKKITTEHATITAEKIILAGGAYLNYEKKLVPDLNKKLMPAGTYIIATEPLGDMADQLLKKNQACCDSNFVLDYFRCSDDKRLLFGGRCSYTTWEPDNLMRWMKPRMLRVFPQLKDCAIEYGWGGTIGLTRNRIPHCGFLHPDIIFTQGFSGHGVVLSGYYGYLMANSIQGTSEDFEILRSIEHKNFPGGQIRQFLLAGAMMYYRLKDIVL